MSGLTVMWGRSVDLAVVFAGILAGMTLFYTAPDGALVLQWACLLASVYLFRVLVAPGLAWVSGFWTAFLLQAWYVFPFTLVMLLTAAAVRLALALPEWLTIPAGDVATAIPFLIGGAVGLIGGTWLADAKDAESALWPTAAARAVIAEAFLNRLEEVEAEDYPLAYDMVHYRVVSLENGHRQIVGWRLGGARRRIRGLQTLFDHARLRGGG